MNAGTRNNRLQIMIYVLPVITVLALGLGSGSGDIRYWVSGAALGCAEIVALWFLFRIRLFSHSALPLPFRIASGLIAGMYAITAVLEVMLLGYLFKPSVSIYASAHIVTLIAFLAVITLIEIFGKQAAIEQRKQSGLLGAKRKTSKRVASIREQIRALSDLPHQQELLDEIKQLEEAVQFGNPVMNSSIDEINSLIEQKWSLLEDQIRLITEVPAALKVKLTQEAIQLTQDILRTVNERSSQATQHQDRNYISTDIQ